MFLEQMADFAGRAVLVVREDLDDYGGAAGAVTLVLRFFVRHAGLFTRAAADGTLDVFGRHVRGFRVADDRAQARVHVRVTAAGACRDRQLLDDARENPAALGVERAFLVFDGRPF